MENAINWFDIPATNYERAKTFYTTILGKALVPMEGMPNYVMFPSDRDGVGGGLSIEDGLKPGATGTLIYLNAGEDLSPILDRVEGAGGEVVMPKTSIGSNGFVARFKDTEGNLIGLHSMK